MKTPGRFMMFYLAVVVAVLVGGSLFPMETAEFAKWGMALLIPTAIGVTICISFGRIRIHTHLYASVRSVINRYMRMMTNKTMGL
jgi:hypothetical protein